MADCDGSTARLTILQVYPEDEGEYACVAYNELGRASTAACLIVDGKLPPLNMRVCSVRVGLFLYVVTQRQSETLLRVLMARILTKKF